VKSPSGRDLAVAFGLLLGTTHTAIAQEVYPVRPVRFIVPFAPGGGNDLIARVLAQRLSERWGQQFIVDNRAGGGGVVGTELAAKSTPDGYTLLLGHTGTLAINPGLYRVGYDPLRDFAPISYAADTPLVLVVHPSVAAASVSELIALARATSGGMNFASGGIGTGSHLSGELFKSMTGLRMTHIAYKGTGPAVTDLLGGQVQLMFSVFPTALPHIATSKLRALAVTSRERSKLLAQLPTVAESGLAGYEAVLRYGVAAPRGVPPATADRLSAEIGKVLQVQQVREFLAKNGAEPVGGGPAQYAEVIRNELALWGKVIKTANVRVD